MCNFLLGIPLESADKSKAMRPSLRFGCTVFLQPLWPKARFVITRKASKQSAFAESSNDFLPVLGEFALRCRKSVAANPALALDCVAFVPSPARLKQGKQQFLPSVG
jgi:hypothetical protein